MSLGRLKLVAVICVSLGTTARAAIIATWVRDDPSTRAINYDPALAQMQSWLLRVTHNSGDWDEAGLQAQLLGGATGFYNHPSGSDTRPDPGAVAIVPALAYDTYVSSPADDGVTVRTKILGGFPSGQAKLSGSIFSAFWRDDVITLPTTFVLARLTFPRTAQLNVINQGDLPPPHQNASSYTTQVNPSAFALILELHPIPEPAGLIAAAVIGLVALRRRG